MKKCISIILFLTLTISLFPVCATPAAQDQKVNKTLELNTSSNTINLENNLNGKKEIIIRFAKWGWTCISGMDTLNWVWDQAPKWVKDYVNNTINLAYNQYKANQEYMERIGLHAWDPWDFVILI